MEKDKIEEESPISANERPLPTEPERVIAFASFFKRYMSVSSVVTAALPIPITKLNLIPTFEAYRNVLSVYTSLFCFLILGFIFYVRHHLGRHMFPDMIEGFRGSVFDWRQLRL
jgi:hypothetical protein